MPNSDPYELSVGSQPLLVSMPHSATKLPQSIRHRLTAAGGEVADTDWHIDRLYAFAADMGASVLRPRWSRYLIDLNRPPDGAPLYPGQDETGLCPVTAFDYRPLYRAGAEPDRQEIQQRCRDYWQPYHHALAKELDRLRERHGYALLWDAHSIASRVPRFFSGTLKPFNLGSADGRACPASLTAAVAEVIAEHGYEVAIDGRFKGGYITRCYGQPQQKVFALQLELVQSSYMREGPPWVFNASVAAPVCEVLRDLLGTYLRVAGNLLLDG